jgi:hypothetical protein
MRSIIFAGLATMGVASMQGDPVRADVDSIFEQTLIAADSLASKLLSESPTMMDSTGLFVSPSLDSHKAGDPISNMISGFVGGDHNSLFIDQGGSNNTISFIQSGSRNNAHIQQSGRSGRIVFKQVGSGNIVQIRQ